jgi:esterase/lipase superfamily enzyme
MRLRYAALAYALIVSPAMSMAQSVVEPVTNAPSCTVDDEPSEVRLSWANASPVQWQADANLVTGPSAQFVVTKNPRQSQRFVIHALDAQGTILCQTVVVTEAVPLAQEPFVDPQPPLTDEERQKRVDAIPVASQVARLADLQQNIAVLSDVQAQYSHVHAGMLKWTPTPTLPSSLDDKTKVNQFMMSAQSSESKLKTLQNQLLSDPVVADNSKLLAYKAPSEVTASRSLQLCATQAFAPGCINSAVTASYPVTADYTVNAAGIGDHWGELLSRQTSSPDSNVKVFFATERAASGANFGGLRNARPPVAYGIASVHLHNGKAVSVPTKMMANDGAFYQQISNYLRDYSPKKQVIVFVHGYNNSFEDMAERAALLQAATGEALVAYDWPSQEGVFSYVADRTTIEASVDALAAFLATLKDRTGAASVSVVAHSMGNRVLMEALDRLRMMSTVPAIHELVLAAADIDTFRFQQILPAVMQTNKIDHVTLYVSESDFVINSSALLNKTSIVGHQPLSFPALAPKIDMIDVQSVTQPFALARLDESKSHAYFVTVPIVLTDIAKVLENGPDMGSRSGLKKQTNGELVYYIF